MGTQQPCDLLSVFHFLKFIQKQIATLDTSATGLGNAIDEPFLTILDVLVSILTGILVIRRP
jgi:hypothetical protein